MRFDAPLTFAPIGATSAEEPRQDSDGPVMRAYQASMQALSRAQSDVLAQHKAQRDRGRWVLKRVLSLATLPELHDHAFFRQPKGWRDPADTGPVVPMTGLLELMMDAAGHAVPNRACVGLENVQAMRWLSVAEPCELTIIVTQREPGRLLVELGEYARGTVLLDGCPDCGNAAGATSPSFALLSERAPSIDARALYTEGWMFHGLAYQGITRLGPLGANGICGRIESSEALGSLLDNAGQLLGYWVMAQTDVNRLAMPLGVRNVRFLGPRPRPFDPVECSVQVRLLEKDRVLADMLLEGPAGIWALIEGWEDRRFVTDDLLFAVIRDPAQRMLSAAVDTHLVLFDDHYHAATTRQYMAGRYLDRTEHVAFESTAPADRRQYLADRIAAKDAVRQLLSVRGDKEVFPVEVALNLAEGKARRMGSADDYRVALARAGTLTAAVAGTRAARVAVVSLETLQASATPLTDKERAVLAGDDGLAWQAQLQAAKRVAGALGPISSVIDRAERRFLFATGWIETVLYGNYGVAWSVT